MAHRKDKFKVGDVVDWVEEYASRGHVRTRHGNGPFEITAVFDRKRGEFDEWTGQTNWDAMGHTQHVCIDGGSEDKCLSGAYFVKAGG